MTMSESVSASRAREPRTQSATSVAAPPSTSEARCVVTCHGPAAKATKYVLSGGVGAKRCVTDWAVLSRRPATPLANACQPRGVTSVNVTRALRSGWSKHGKSRLASDGTSNVYR